MNPLSTLRQKPWLSEASIPQSNIPELDTLRAAGTALRFIMAIVGVLFFLFIITFLARSQYPDFQALAGPPWQPFSDPSRLWFNTALLAVSSLALEFGLRRLHSDQVNPAIAAISAGVFFAIAFIVAQLDLWGEMQRGGFLVNTNPANSYFYLLTAVHGMHLLGGLIVLAAMVLRSTGEGKAFAGSLRLCTTYWHFLLAIWLVLFALLTSEASTINSLAAMCGF